MQYIKTPMKGMPEQLPADMQLREYLLGKIKATYGSYGFSLIETPAIEHIENLTSRQGGENEKLIFKILKRGEKLAKADGTDELCDCGLRYDLTVPLSRFYANNMAQLPVPFKAMQIGNVWRADRPQRGRFRQFTQCDIDILGEGSFLAEIELISATASMLAQLEFSNFKVKVNDRRILKAMAACCGFAEENYDDIFIILDKIDKIGLDGVKAELLGAGYDSSSVERYCAFFENLGKGMSCTEFCADRLDGFLDPAVLSDLEYIINCARATAAGEMQIVFDPTLVRGMSYYTGPIFEIELPDFGSSVAGGGRYDEMIGKYTNAKVPACGFSIGFERIITLLKERGYRIPDQKNRTALLIDKKIGREELLGALQRAAQLRAGGETALIVYRAKNIRHQKETLEKEGYTEFLELPEKD